MKRSNTSSVLFSSTMASFVRLHVCGEYTINHLPGKAEKYTMIVPLSIPPLPSSPPPLLIPPPPLPPYFALRSRQRTELWCFSRVMENGLSRKIFKIWRKQQVNITYTKLHTLYTTAYPSLQQNSHMTYRVIACFLQAVPPPAPRQFELRCWRMELPTCPFLSPTSSASLPGGPPTTLM